MKHSRDARPWAALFLALAALACSKSTDSTDNPDAGDDTRAPTPSEWDRAVTRPDDKAASDGRAACKFAAGAMPAETLGASTPVDKDIPIETVIVLMMENRSFDSYFGHLNKYAGRTDIESAPDDTKLPDKAGGAPATHPYQHGKHLCFLDTNHEWSGSHKEANDGKMDGFYEVNQGWDQGELVNPTPALYDGERALWWYDERDIPFYYELAKTFAIADHYHASLLGPTWPNRMYLYAGTSFGKASNVFPELTLYTYPEKDSSIFDELEKRHVDWSIYYQDAPGAGLLYATAILSRWGRNPLHNVQEFFDAASQGTLPSVVFLDPPGLAVDNADSADEHPPADVHVGQKFASDVVRAVMQGPQWKKTALFITYDEHGGVFDHVPPPSACKPDDTPPKLEGADVGTVGGFDRLGVRVPLIVVSPYAKRAYVSHAVYDHTSITRFLQAKFKVPALSGRDANADPLMDLFDFKAPAFVDPPNLPQPTIDQAELDYCKTTYVKKR
jgi:phospholipase C